MSVYAAERVRQVMDHQVSQALAPLVLNTPAIERVEGWLEDMESLTAFQTELAFMVLRGLLKNDGETLRHAGSVSWEEWTRALARAEEMRRSGEIPDLEYPPDQPGWVVPWLTTSAFVYNQYSHGREVRVRPGDVFLDCGGCGGETAVWAARQGAGRVFSFEPDPAALPYLQRNLEAHAPGLAEVVPLALGEEPGWLEIIPGPGAANHLGGARLAGPGSGGAKVEVTTLDAWCENRGLEPGFIKMDLEGSEPAALRGARRILAEARPRLAISLYHRLSDMWIIPAIIKEACPDYRFWCRKNAPMVEFVLYAAA